MKRVILIKRKQFELLKQEARKLKKSEHLPHHEALDAVAKAHGFHHWHDVCECHKATEPIEIAGESGLIVGFDFSEKDGMDSYSGEKDFPFIEDHGFLPLFKKSLFTTFCDSPYVDMDENLTDKTLKEAMDTEELDEFFDEQIGSLYYYRYTGDSPLPSLDEAMMLMDPYSYWPPRVVLFKGELINTMGYQATNEDGSPAGLRLTLVD